MAGEWEEISLAAVMDVKHGFAFPGEYIRDEPPGDILLTPGNFAIGGGFKGDKLKYFDGEVPVDYVLSEGDLVVTMTDLSKQADTLGYPALVPKPRGPRFLHNQRLGKVLIKKGAELDKNFLFYLLRTAEYRHEVLASATGTTVKHTSPRRILAHKASIPSLAEQKAIAAVLGALDDKIELNRRMNATLEAMARALFQSWFVDFDPVRAKLDGRHPINLDRATAALFPDSFNETEFGNIPYGWKTTTLGEACKQGGGNIQTGPFGTQLHASDYVDEGIPSIMPSDLRDNRINTSSIARIREEDAERLKVYRVQAGDVVYSRRGDVERRSLIRRNEHAWLCGTGCLRVRFGPHGLNPFFGASYLGTLESRAWVVRHAVGATMPNLNTLILGALPMVVPPRELQARFAEIVGPWDERGTIALEESRTLSTLRDTLLPKLLSGELSLRSDHV